MMNSEGQWFSQDWVEAGLKLGLKIDKVLVREKSKYQEIIVLKSCCHGNVLVLNGDIQCTEEDEFSYHEMIVHIPLFCHPAPKQRVLEICRKYVPNMAKYLSHSKVEIVVDDGIQFIKKHSNAFDVIITDVPEPYGPAENIYKKDYFTNMKRALTSGGIISCQGETIHKKDLPFLQKIMKVAKEIFPRVDYAFSLVPTYIGGNNGFFLFSNNPNMVFMQPLTILTDYDIKKMQLKYYNSDIHKASFCLPQYVKEALASEDEKC